MLEREIVNNKNEFNFWKKKSEKISSSSYAIESAMYGLSHIIFGFALMALFIGYFNEGALNATGHHWKSVVYDGVVVSSSTWLCLYASKIALKLFNKKST